MFMDNDKGRGRTASRPRQGVSRFAPLQMTWQNEVTDAIFRHFLLKFDDKLNLGAHPAENWT